MIATAMAFLLTTGIAAAAVPTYATVPPPSATGPGKKIAVKTCSPTRNVTTTAVGPPGYGPGYYPGFYPGRGYYWDDPYGYPYFQAPIAVNTTGSLQIDYVNITPQTMETIDFGLIANGRLVAEVRDVGTFSPNVEIKHSFGLNPNVFPLSTALPQCIPLRITYKDQATWVNPHLPSLQRHIYESP